MRITELVTFLAGRRPIDKVPLDWNRLGYTTPGFDRVVRDTAWPGWKGDLPDEEEAGVVASSLRAVPGNSLLDVACGYGRHSILLAGRDLKVTGVDIAPGLIESAGRRAREAGVSPVFLTRDARKMEFSEEFDLAMIAFNSFAIFSPEDAPKVLKGVRRALKPGGRLFLDLPHRRAYFEYPSYESHWHLSRGALTLQEISFRHDPEVEVCRDLIFHPAAGDVEEFMVLVRMYSRDEIAALLAECGFEILKIYGGWNLCALEPSGSKMLLVAVRT